MNLIESFIVHFNIPTQTKREINKAVFGFDMSPKMEEKIYKIGNKLKQYMEEKKKGIERRKEIRRRIWF